MLRSNTTGNDNTASGEEALRNNTTGSFNTASGVDALRSNITGNNNTASGGFVLRNNTTGVNNTALGVNALQQNQTGSLNLALGVNAGFNLKTGSNNIYLGHAGGAANETGAMRLGSSGQTSPFIAVVNSTYINSVSVCELLHKIDALQLTVPITRQSWITPAIAARALVQTLAYKTTSGNNPYLAAFRNIVIVNVFMKRSTSAANLAVIRQLAVNLINKEKNRKPALKQNA